MALAAPTTKPLQHDHDVVVRPLARFPPNIWGDRFQSSTLEDDMRLERYAKELKALKENVRMMLSDDSTNLAQKMSLIDAVEHLGFPYYYKNEINELLDHIFQEYSRVNFNMDCDLYDTALQFRIFRLHGYNLPCDVFNKFTDDKGKFKEVVKTDLRGMMSLYEAACLRVHGEQILEEAFVLTTDFLKSKATFSEEASWTLKQPFHQGHQRVQTHHFISVYEKDESRNEKLLQLAKIEYNRMQILYCQELSQVQKYWIPLKKLPYIRHRAVESHFWTLIAYQEPQCSLARILYSRILAVITLLDDTYDAYGTFEELQQLTDAFHRWDLSLVEMFPEEYMKIAYEFVINTCNEIADEMNKRGNPYAGLFMNEQVLKLIRNYMLEAKWVKSRYLPTYEEYMRNGRVTAAAQICVTAGLLGIDEGAQVKPYIQVMQVPKVITASEDLTRLMDDIVTGEAEIARGVRLCTSIECYMKDHNMSTEAVLQKFNKMIDDAWKDVIHEGLLTSSSPDDYDHFSKPVYDLVFNFVRATDLYFKVKDGYTFPEEVIKEDIIITYAQPFNIQI